LVSGAEELRREFDLTRRELDEMANDILAAERNLAELSRRDIQAGELRSLLADTKERHARLQGRLRKLELKYSAAEQGRPDRTH
jgi:predicted RNA-binding protein